MNIFNYWPTFHNRSDKAKSWDSMNIWKCETKEEPVDNAEFTKLVESLKSSEYSLKKSGRSYEAKGVKRARLKIQKLLRVR